MKSVCIFKNNFIGIINIGLHKTLKLIILNAMQNMSLNTEGKTMYCV